jgi:2-polyprenyl-6-methoxyphenol hydroxylase-like FAD-dependent oxidoreductase
MTETFDADVLVCGAGAAGLALAIDLARCGVSFRLIEKMDGPFRGSRGKGIQPRSQEVFEDLGIIDRIVAVGGVYPPQRAYRRDGSYEESQIMENRDATPAEPYRIPLMVPQFLTEGVMRERLAELEQWPMFGRELRGFEQDDGGCRCGSLTRWENKLCASVISSARMADEASCGTGSGSTSLARHLVCAVLLRTLL